jgi:hypothetical protein
MQCPGCSHEMAAQTLEGHYGRRVQLDWCAGCGAFWFDTNESIALAPGSVLRLFTLIHEKPAEARPPLPDTLACPRCHVRLARTVDVQRGTRFHYFRCPGEHGRFITCGEFLREKNFVRPLAPAEMAELRRHVQMIQCSSCGAPVDLATGSACSHCGAPVSMLDPNQVETVVRALTQAEERRKTVDPALAGRLLMDRLEVDRLFRDRQSGWLDVAGPVGLVEAGIAAVAGMLSALD